MAPKLSADAKKAIAKYEKKLAASNKALDGTLASSEKMLKSLGKEKKVLRALGQQANEVDKTGI
jgi:hypothetical protein